MVKVSIEVHSETARFAVAVQAKSIRQALSIVAARYPGSVASVKFPIDLGSLHHLRYLTGGVVNAPRLRFTSSRPWFVTAGIVKPVSLRDCGRFSAVSQKRQGA
jgi:hypothetical protein